MSDAVQTPIQAGFGFDEGAPDYDRLRAFDADFTPGPIVRQGLEWTGKHLFRDASPQRVLDPSAGGGVFGQQAARVWPNAFRTGIEPRPEEEIGLARHYHAHEVARFEDWAVDIPDGMSRRGFADLVATNPPFSLFPLFVEHGLELLSPSGVLMLLGLSTWGQSIEGIELFDRFPPAIQLRIGGRIGFRGHGANPKTGKPWGVDQRDYSWWLWIPSFPPTVLGGSSAWMTIQLRALTTAQRTWRVKPGSEAPKSLTRRGI